MANRFLIPHENVDEGGKVMERIGCKITVTMIAILLAVPAAGWDSTDSMGGDRQGRDQRMKPPPEAYTACEGKSEGASVRVTTPDGKTIEATCRSLDGQLVAAPKMSGRRPGNGQPPPDGAGMETR